MQTLQTSWTDHMNMETKSSRYWKMLHKIIQENLSLLFKRPKVQISVWNNHCTQNLVTLSTVTKLSSQKITCWRMQNSELDITYATEHLWIFFHSNVQCEDVTQSTNYSRTEYLFGLKIFPLRAMEWIFKKIIIHFISLHNLTSWFFFFFN